MSDPNHIADLTPDPKNARKHTPRNIGMIERALGEVGAARSIVIDEDGRILAGNGTVEAAAAAGITRVQVVEADGETIIAVRRRGLTEEQKRRLALYDNRAAELADGWDADVLLEMVNDGLDPSAFFYDRELGDILGAAMNDILGELPAGEVPDEPATRVAVDLGNIPDDANLELQRKWGTEVGDIWRLEGSAGPHFIACGDTFAAATWAAIAQHSGAEVVADAIITDPPFAIYGSSSGLAADITDDRIVRPFFENVITGAERLVKYYGHVYVFCDWRSFPTIWDVARPTRVDIKNLLVWDKGTTGVGAMYANVYELVAFFVKQLPQFAMGNRPAGQRIVQRPNIIRAARTLKSEKYHNAQKPLAVLAELVTNATDPGELIVDLFAGTGSTIIAAEQAGRRCYTAEIEPKYVAVTLERYHAATGKTATKVGTIGETP
jgi:DNA modification methylase